MNGRPYRLAVGIMVLNARGEVFIARRRNRALVEHVAEGYEWQMPQGGVDRGEDLLAAAKRELREETNISSVRLLAEAPDWYAYDLPEDVLQKAWKGRYRGQRQKWFAFRFEGREDEIDLDAPAGGAHPEFDAWRWEAITRLPDLIIPFKREVYEKVVAAFAHLAGP